MGLLRDRTIVYQAPQEEVDDFVRRIRELIEENKLEQPSLFEMREPND